MRLSVPCLVAGFIGGSVGFLIAGWEGWLVALIVAPVTALACAIDYELMARRSR